MGARLLPGPSSLYNGKIINMSIHDVRLSFFPKYQFLLGINFLSHETFDMKDEQAYDGMDIELGVGIIVLSITILKRKGAV